MTLKTKKFLKKSDLFCRNIFGKVFWLIFQNFQLKFLDFGKKKNWFYKIFWEKKRETEKKNNPAKMENLGRLHP